LGLRIQRNRVSFSSDERLIFGAGRLMPAK
jgi:hypothetical protein